MSELRADLRASVSSLFISGGASGDTAVHAGRLAAAVGNQLLVKELASREVRARLFLLAHASFSSSKASSSPELVRDVSILLRAVAARTRGALSSLASDVGARPLINVLMRASLKERGSSPAGGSVDEAAVAVAELLERLVLLHPRSCAALRLDAGVESVCTLLVPSPPEDEALLRAVVRLLSALVNGSDAAARCAARKGVPAIALTVLSSRMENVASVGPLLSLLGAVCAVAPVVSERARVGAAAGAGGAPTTGAVIASATRALTLHGVVDKEIAVGALATISGVIAGCDAEGAVAAGAAMAAAGTFSAIRESLVAHAAPADLSRHAASACARVTAALTLSREGRHVRPLLPSPMSVGYSATGLRMSIDGAPKVSSGHLSLVASTLAPPHASASPACWPADVAPPATIALWPLPAEYTGWSPSGLAPYAAALPTWAGTFLPRAGFFPYSADLDDGGSGRVRGCASSICGAGNLPSAAEIARAMTAWLHAPHWFPELQGAAALLAELSQTCNGASAARLSDSDTAAVRTYIAAVLVELARARRAPADDGSECWGTTRTSTPAMHPSTRIGPIGCGSVHPLVSLDSASASQMRDLLGADGAFPFDAAQITKNAAPSVPGAASPAIPALRSSLLLDHGGDFDDSSLSNLALPRVHVLRDGLRSVRVFTLAGAATPSAPHAPTPVVALGAPLAAATITGSMSARLPVLTPALRASDEIASLCASPLADGYVVKLGDFTGEANIVEALEPSLATSADIEKDVARRLLLASAARNCLRAEAACASAFHRNDAPSLLYFRHALPEGAHKPNSLPPALCIGPFGAVLTATASEPACPASIPLPRSFVGTARPLAPPIDALRSSAHARDIPGATFALSVADALGAPINMVTPLTPRPVALLDDGPPPSSSAINDEGAESGEEDVAEADAEATKVGDDAALRVEVSAAAAEASAAGTAAVAAAWAAAANEASREVPPLEFESRFESGNLCSAVRVGSTSYELALDPDVNTAGFSQWFFFRVRDMISNTKYTFSLINMGRDGSVFLGGQRPWVYFERGPQEGVSCRDGTDDAGVAVRVATVDAPPAVVPGEGWRRAGEELTYHKNVYERPRVRVSAPVWSSAGADETDGACVSPVNIAGPRFSHAWTITFPAGTTAAWFAYAPPYTYTDLRRDISRWEMRAEALGRGEQVIIASPSGSDVEHVDASVAAVAPLCVTPASSPQTKSEVRDAFSRLGYAPAGSAFEPRGGAASHSSSVALGALFSSPTLVRSTLCTSLAGNPVPLLTITDFSDGPAAVALRPFVVLSARVHPGETNSSWMMRGLLDTLTSSAPVAVDLRKRVVFKIVPMLNPDGVINGSHRTNLAGLDLNRVWAEPALSTAPTIWHLRALIMTIQARAAAAAARMSLGAEVLDGIGDGSLTGCALRLPPVATPVLMFCDFHGHSRRRNAFTFGCHDVTGAGGAPPVPGVLPPAPDSDDANVSGRLFPKLLASRAETFAFSSCGWKVTRDKLSAARVSMWRDACLPLSYTLEAPFGSPSAGARAGAQVSTRSFIDVGITFTLALLDLLEGPTGIRASAAAAALSAPRQFVKLSSPLRPRSNTAPPSASRMLSIDSVVAETARGASGAAQSPVRVSKSRRAKPKRKEVEIIIFDGGSKKAPLTAQGGGGK